MMIVYYGDESGTGKNQAVKTCVIAGYLAKLKDIVEAQWQWKKKVLEAGPPIRYFKTNHCLALRGEFAGWDRPRADRKLDAAIQVLIDNADALLEVSSSIEWSVFESIPQNIKDYIGHPYHFCMHGVVDQSVRYAREQGNLSEPVIFMLEESNQYETLATQHYNRIRELFPYLDSKIGKAVRFGDDKRIEAFQMCDLLASEVRRDLDGVKSGRLDQLRGKLRHDSRRAEWNARNIDAACREIENRARAQGYIS